MSTTKAAKSGPENDADAEAARAAAEQVAQAERTREAQGEKVAPIETAKADDGTTVVVIADGRPPLDQVGRDRAVETERLTSLGEKED